MTYSKALPGMVAAFGLSLAASADWQHMTSADGVLPSDGVNAILEGASSGKVWICTTKGLVYAENGQLKPQPILVGDKPKAVSVWTVLEENAEKTWVGHSQGSSLLAKDKQQLHSHGGTPARFVFLGRYGLWCVTASGEQKKVQWFNRNEWHVMHFDAGRIRPADPTKDAKHRMRAAAEGQGSTRGSTRIVDIYTAPDGRIWLTVDGNGVIEVDPKKGVAGYTHHLKDLNVTAAFQGSAGDMWFGLWSRGVCKLANGKTTFFLERKLARCAVMHVAEDQSGGILVSTNLEGLWRRPKGRQEWTRELPDAGSITLLEVTRDGRIWVGAQDFGGLKVWDGKGWSVGYESTMPMRCLTETKNGDIWVGGVLDGVRLLKAQPPSLPSDKRRQ